MVMKLLKFLEKEEGAEREGRWKWEGSGRESEREKGVGKRGRRRKGERGEEMYEGSTGVRG